ncbi:MAG: RluA family pseudouridine synthase [Gallionella sp.]
MSLIYNPPPDTGQEIIRQDEHMLVVNKPAGLLTVPGRGEDKADCLITRVQQTYSDALIVHRLDMATSGLVLLARGAEMQQQLSKMFREREVQKHYIALVSGRLLNEVGEIDLPLLADWQNRPRQRVNLKEGKPSLTRYRLIAFENDVSRVELEPATGRTHQLRLHMAAIGHPIIGDILYGGRTAERLMLHAQRLNFVHPLSGERLRVECAASF